MKMGKREGISLILKNRISQILDFLKMCTSENPTAEIRWSQGTGFTGSTYFLLLMIIFGRRQNAALCQIKPL